MSAFSLLLVVADDDLAGQVETLLPTVSDTARCTRVRTLQEARSALEPPLCDVILFDPTLDSSDPLDSIRSLHATAPSCPLVILGDAADAASLVAAGAHDFLDPERLNDMALRRAITYALARQRQTELGELKSTLERHRGSVGGTEPDPSGPPVEADGSIRRRHPDVVVLIDDHYNDLLVTYLEHLVHDGERPGEAMRSVAKSLVDLDAGPRDVLAVHVRALEKAVHGSKPEMARAYAVAARTLALEMMALVTTLYRERALGALDPTSSQRE